MADEIPTINPDSDDLSDLDILNDDSPSGKDDKSKDDKSKDKEETSDEEIDKVDEEDPDEEIEEVEEKDVEGSKVRPSLKSMIEKSPEVGKVLKEFPQLRDAYYREAQFTELFPTVDDAKEAAEKAEALDVFNGFVMEGSSKEILEAIQKDNPEAYKNFATGFLPTLAKMDNNLFYEVSIPIVNRVIRNLFATGERSKDQNQMAAAKIVAHYLHGEYEIPAVETNKVDPEVEAERKKLEQEKNQFKSEKAQEFEGGVQSRTNKAFTKLVSEGLDPENSLSEFTKNKIIDEVIERVGKELHSDREHMSKMQKLWKAAESGRFSSESADRIISAFLSRAKQLIPEIRAKVKKEATGVVRRSNNNGTGRTTRRSTDTGTGSGRSTSTTETDPKKINWRKVSDLDLLK